MGIMDYFFSFLPTTIKRKTRSKAKLVIAAADWAELPSDLIASIADHLTLDMTDYLRFRAVCKAWRASTIDPRHRKHPPQLPWLIVENSFDSNCISILSLSDGRKHSIKLPDIGGTRFVSFACNGWLVLEEYCFSSMLILWNPTTGELLHLPTMSGLEGIERPENVVEPDQSFLFRYGGQTMRYDKPSKDTNNFRVSSTAMSSSDPSSCTFVVSFAYSTVLARCRIGDDSWTVVDMDYAYYSDVVFVGGDLYAVTHEGDIVVFSSTFDKVEHVWAPTLTDNVLLCRWQIVESEGKVMVVSRSKGSKPVIDVEEHLPVYDTEKVLIFGLEVKDDILSLVELNSLAGKMLFTGYCHPIVIPIDNYHLGKEDCVYFADQFFTWALDNLVCCLKSVVVSLRDGTMEELPYNRADTSVIGTNNWFSSIWLTPRFY